MRNRYASSRRAHVATGLASVLVVLLGGTAVAVPVGAEFQVSTSANEEKAADVGVAADDSFVIVWEDKVAFDILARRYDAFGNPLGAVFQVSTSANEQKGASIAVAADGSFVIAWEDKDALDILARRYDAFGNPLGAVFQVSASANEQKDADVAVATDGSFVVVWEDKTATDVMAREYSALGVPLGGEFVVNTTVLGDQKKPSISVNADGDYVVVWEDKNTLDIYGQRYAVFHQWAFDEGSGPTAADSSASANDATLQSTATWTSDCSGASALEFDGLGGHAITAQPFSPQSTGTIAFWMRSAGTPAASSSIFGLGDNWEVRQEPGGTLSFDLGADGPPEFVTVAPLDQANRWYHVVAVFDAADDSFQVYVDGQLDASGVNGDDMVAQSAGQLSFGTRTGSSDYWEGAVRDFRIYGNKLTAEEVATLYGILAHWKLDETSGTVVVDSSGRGNDATYVGSPTLGVNGAFPPQTNTAVQLDGASEYVNSNQSLLNDVDEFTLAGWFHPTSLSPVKSYFGQHGLIEVGIDVTTNQIELWTSQGGVINASNLLSPGKWKHIAAVGNGSSLTLYVDGREVATGGSIAITYGSNAEVFKIGEGVMDVSGGYFDGRIDDVRVYNRALCPEEINAVYKGGRPAGVRILQWLETR